MKSSLRAAGGSLLLPVGIFLGCLFLLPISAAVGQEVPERGVRPTEAVAAELAPDEAPVVEDLEDSFESVGLSLEPDPGEIFVRANTAYEERDYDQAIRLYGLLLESRFDNGHLHYNLGNALLRNGELGRAIASYRRGLRLLPRDEDVRANLAFARKSRKDAIAPPETSVLVSTLFFWHQGLNPTELETAVLILNLLFWSTWMFRLFHRDSEVLRWTFILLLVLLIATAGSVVAHRAFPARIAVVVPQEINAHTGPEEGSVVRFKLHAGTEVEVDDRRGSWLRISLPDGQRGWLEEAWVELVSG
jgi:tetratricopeptide (TPR) repeat protein